MHWRKFGQDGVEQVDCGLLPSVRCRDRLVYDRRGNGDAGRIQCQSSGRETVIELEGREEVKLSIDTVIEKFSHSQRQHTTTSASSNDPASPHEYHLKKK